MLLMMITCSILRMAVCHSVSLYPYASLLLSFSLSLSLSVSVSLCLFALSLPLAFSLSLCLSLLLVCIARSRQSNFTCSSLFMLCGFFPSVVIISLCGKCFCCHGDNY